jgi:hypothetical protein
MTKGKAGYLLIFNAYSTDIADAFPVKVESHNHQILLEVFNNCVPFQNTPQH